MKELDAILEEMGKKIVNGIVISIAIDEDFDTQPIEDWMKKKVEELLEKERIQGLKDYSRTCGILRVEPTTRGLKMYIDEVEKKIEEKYNGKV